VGENPRVQSLREAEHYTTGGVIYFTGDAFELTEDNRRILQVVAQQIGGKPQKIEIRGHTSTRQSPECPPHKTHWNLAFERSRQVADFLVELGINPKRLRIAVAADKEPIHIGNDPLLQKKNDRVEVTMLNELIEDLQGTAEEKEQRYSNEKDRIDRKRVLDL